MSSYNQSKLEYGDIFKVITLLYKPKKIIEFGILNGYSLENLYNKDCDIEAYDIFEEFVGNKANYEEIVEKFKDKDNIKICYGDYYKKFSELEDNSIDLIHIDIANDGDVYRFAIKNYFRKLTKNGILLLEGGSEERDNVYWMTKYKKTKINNYLEELKKTNKYDILVLNKFPSLTIIRSK